MTQRTVYVGCRTTAERDGHGTGLTTWDVDAAGHWTLRATHETVNPSYLAVDPAGRRMCAVHGDGTTLTGFTLHDDGTPEPTGTIALGGRNPVHVAFVGPDEIAVAMLASGSVAFVTLGPTGAPDAVRRIGLTGPPGPLDEQDGPHPHQIHPLRGTDRILVPDKGVDVVHELTTDGRVLGAIPMAAGSGPRHLVEHPHLPATYVVGELDSTVTVLLTAGYTTTPIQLIPVLPHGDPREGIAAAIALTDDGRHLYVSHRGADVISHFDVDPVTGTLSRTRQTDCGGSYPRFMTLDPTGTRLLVAHERSDTIATFTIDTATGALTPDGPAVPTGSPVCIVFRPDPSARLRRAHVLSATRATDSSGRSS